MGAAEDRSQQDIEPERVPEFTDAERAKLRALLDLLDRAGRGKVDQPGPAKVEPAAPTAEDFAELRARRRRRAHRHG